MGVNGATDIVTNANPPPRNPDTVSSKEENDFKETIDRSTTSNDSSKQSQGTSNSYPIILATRPPINLAHSTGNQGAPSQAGDAPTSDAPAAAEKAPAATTHKPCPVLLLERFYRTLDGSRPLNLLLQRHQRHFPQNS